MTDNEATVAVPVSLIERAYEQSGDPMQHNAVEALYELAHPRPTPRRIVVVDLDALNVYTTASGKPGFLVNDLEAAPDVLDVDSLAQIIRRVDGNHDLGAGALAEAIRSAIEETI